jgi:hypothetical protein
VRQVLLDDVAMVAAGVGPGALYADDTLEIRARQVH